MWRDFLGCVKVPWEGIPMHERFEQLTDARCAGTEAKPRLLGAQARLRAILSRPRRDMLLIAVVELVSVRAAPLVGIGWSRNRARRAVRAPQGLEWTFACKLCIAPDGRQRRRARRPSSPNVPLEKAGTVCVPTREARTRAPLSAHTIAPRGGVMSEVSDLNAATLAKKNIPTRSACKATSPS